MLPLYLTCMIVGGVFVGLSALGAIGKDVDADGDLDADGDFDASHALEGGHDFDADHDFDHDVDVDHDVGHDFDADAEVPADALTVADASHGVEPRHGKRRVWVPMMSFRFWTFGSAFFGLTGTLLTTLTGAGGVIVAGLSAVTGLGVGTASASVVRWLRKPVGATARLAEYTGTVGELTMALREGSLTRVRLQVGGRQREILARAAEPMALPAGTRVVVLGIDENGQAQIAPEQSIYQLEE